MLTIAFYRSAEPDLIRLPITIAQPYLEVTEHEDRPATVEPSIAGDDMRNLQRAVIEWGISGVAYALREVG